MPPYDYVLRRLCTTLETRQKAERLYVQAAQLTRPGSGHALGAGQAALPAVCAFLASERLGNGEVAQEQARAATSLNAKTFNATLATVERILPSSSSRDNGPTRVTYPSLMHRHGVRADDIVPMKEVEAALSKSGALGAHGLSAQSDLVQCAVFHWVCTRVLDGVRAPDAAALRREFALTRARWAAVHALLEAHCAHMVAGLARDAATAARARATRRAACAGGDVGAGTAGRGTRRASPDARRGEHAGPAQRRGDGGYAPSGLGQDLDTHTPHARRGNAAAAAMSGGTNAAISPDGDEAEEVPSGTIVVRSARTPSNVSHNVAWDAQRPTAKDGHLSTTSPPFTPSNDIASIKSTPMTSTGMSDDCSRGSPSGVQASRPRSLKPLRTPAGKVCASLPEDEEMPRRRRRRLRVPFLDRDAYGWKPSARTKQLLDRAKRWEALMIAKHGDPWADL